MENMKGRSINEKDFTCCNEKYACCNTEVILLPQCAMLFWWQIWLWTKKKYCQLFCNSSKEGSMSWKEHLIWHCYY